MNDKVIQLDNNPQPEQTAYDTVFSALLNFSTPELKKMFTEVLAHKRQDIKSKLKYENDLCIINSKDVSMMMILLKVARELNSTNKDNLIDIAGYCRLSSVIEGFENINVK